MWEVRTGAGGQVSQVLFSLRLALLEHSHPFYKEHQERLFTEATICMAQSGLGDTGSKGGAGQGAGREWKSPAVGGWQLSRLLGGLRSTASSQPHSCLLFPGCGHQDPWRQASCSQSLAWTPTLSIALPSPFSGRPPGIKGKASEAPWARPAGGVLLALLLCSQLDQHHSFESAGTVCGACREKAKSSRPLWGPAIAPQAPLPFPERVGIRDKWL